MMKEFLHNYVCYKCTRRLSLLEKAIEEAFTELAISSLNAQKPTSADIGVSPDTVRLKPSAKLSRKMLVSTIKIYR